MRNVAILFRRELLAYFCSPIAYIVGVCVLGLTGISFNMIVTILTEGPSDYTPLMWFFNGMFTWIILLVVPPVITMRLFADEKRTGTIEALMTDPALRSRLGEAGRQRVTTAFGMDANIATLAAKFGLVPDGSGGRSEAAV